jgi:hypothetical protein
MIPIDTEKAFGKNSISLHDLKKSLSKLGIQENFLKPIKTSIKPTANIILTSYGEKQDTFLLR